MKKYYNYKWQLSLKKNCTSQVSARLSKKYSTATSLLKMKGEIDETMFTVKKQSVFADISKAFGIIYT